MMFARIRNSDDKIVRRRDRENTLEEQNARARKFGLGKKYREVPIEELPDEAHDPATQKLVRTETPEATRLAVQNKAVALTQPELDAKAQRDADELQKIGIEANLNDLRNAVGNDKAQMDRLTEAVDYMLKQHGIR